MMERLQIIADYFGFLRQQKKWVLLPLVILLLIFGALIVLVESSPIVAFIYTVF